MPGGTPPETGIDLMDDLGRLLTAAREARGITVADIADATHINDRFLAALERGEYTLLPQAYVRAHIREYADFVGIDPEEALRVYERMRSPEPPRPAPASPPAPPSAPVVPPTVAGEPVVPAAEAPAIRPDDGAAAAPRFPRTAIVLMLGAAVALAAWVLTRPAPTPTAEEIPFTDVIRESEGAGDTARAAVARPPLPADSLTLSAVVRDTAWMLVAPDGGAAMEYLFAPGRRISWKAAERFTVTVGNAGAVDLSLNGKMLPALGRRGTVARDVTISRADLREE